MNWSSASLPSIARVRVVWRPDLLGTPRYPGDHYPPIQRTDAQSAEWRRLLGEAEVMLDVDQPSAADIVRMAPRLKLGSVVELGRRRLDSSSGPGRDTRSS